MFGENVQIQRVDVSLLYLKDRLITKSVNRKIQFECRQRVNIEFTFDYETRPKNN